MLPRVIFFKPNFNNDFRRLSKDLIHRWGNNTVRQRKLHKHFGVLVNQIHHSHTLLSTESKEHILQNWINNMFTENEDYFINRVSELDQNWSPLNDPIMLALEDIIGEQWGGLTTTLRAYLSIAHKFPRFLDAFEFYVPYKAPLDKTFNVVIHEVQHFLFFKKIKTMFPNEPRETYERPHLNWQVSELIAPTILNHPKILHFVPEDVSQNSYDTEYPAINGKPISIFFKDIYIKQFIDKDFADYIRYVRSYLQENNLS